MVNALALNIRANPCTNRCRHCWTEGSPDNATMPTETLEAVLRELAEAGRACERVDFFLLDEPTNRPDFLYIYEYAAELGLTGSDCSVFTNGARLARASRGEWSRLRASGIGCVQFTFYGVGEKHDKFAGRRGAFDDLVAAARGAEEAGIPWYGGVVLRPDDAGDVKGTMEYVKGLGAPAEVGWLLYQAQGRGAKGRRPTLDDAVEKAGLGVPRFFFPERQIVEEISDSAELSAKAVAEALFCGLFAEVDADGEVFCGGTCDGGALGRALPEFRAGLSLGRLSEKSLSAMVEEYRSAPPPLIETAKAVTWGELAEEYGSRENDELFWRNDVIISRWMRDYVREHFPPA